jgi:hypothetical protein
MLLVEQAENALARMELEERLFAFECALDALDRRAKAILEVRRAEAHEANRAQRDEWQLKLQILRSPAPKSMTVPN